MIAVVCLEFSLKFFPLLLIAAGSLDVMEMRISNKLTLLIGASFVPLAGLSGMPLDLIALHIAVATGLLLAGFILFSLRVIGGGDAKLLAAAGLWLGPAGLGPYLFFSGIAGGAVSLGVGLLFIAAVESGTRSKRLARLFAPVAPDVPYGLPLAAGAILALPYSWWMQQPVSV